MLVVIVSASTASAALEGSCFDSFLQAVIEIANSNT